MQVPFWVDDLIGKAVNFQQLKQPSFKFFDISPQAVVEEVDASIDAWYFNYISL